MCVISHRSETTDYKEKMVRDYERLSAQDSSFLWFEQRSTPMHVSAIAVFEVGPLATAGGGLDAEQITKHVESRLHLLPLYRKRLAFAPIDGQPVWVDDDRFELGYHVRRAALPHPGSESVFKEWVGHTLSQRLDRERPLWELWIVEGLEGGRFALVSKVHHCMIDGVSGMNLLTLLMSPSADETTSPAPPWEPRPAPGPLRLLLDEAARRMGTLGAVASGVRDALRDPRATWTQLTEGAAAIAQALEAGLRPPARTPLNSPIGPHRRVDWLTLDLAAAKAVKARLGGTVNDVVLATVAGGLHRFFGRREWRARLDYRILVPVNMRPPGDERAGGNRVSALFLSLPVEERNPLRRYARIRAESERTKASRAAEGIDLFTRITDWTGSTGLTAFGVRLASRLRPYNLIVTNVPGPQFPLYVLGARLVELYPQVPLFAHQGLGVAVLSYCGRLHFGLTGDWEVARDLGRLREAIGDAFAELVSAAAGAVPPAARRASAVAR